MTPFQRLEGIAAPLPVEILAGGTINSPHLLMLSGIGPAPALERHGVRTLHDLPGVGRNLQDHACAPVTMMDPSSHAYALSLQALPRVLASPFQYLLNRSGMLATNAAEGGGLFRTLLELDRPDVQVTLLAGLKDTARAIPREHGIMLLVTLLRPGSRGSVTLASSRPADRPLIRPAFLEHREDVQTLVAGVRETRRILSMPPIADLLGIVQVPRGGGP